MSDMGVELSSLILFFLIDYVSHKEIRWNHSDFYYHVEYPANVRFTFRIYVQKLTLSFYLCHS